MPITKATASSIAPAAKGDLVVGSATNDAAVLGVGSNDQVLTADSSTATGLKWAAAAGGAGNMVQIATGTASGSSVSLTGLSTYSELLLVLYSMTNNTANEYVKMTINNNTGSNYTGRGFRWDGASMNRWDVDDTFIYLSGDYVTRTNTSNVYTIKLTNCKTTGFTDMQIISEYPRSGGNTGIISNIGVYKVSEAVSSIEFFSGGGTWSAGTYTLWGA